MPTVPLSPKFGDMSLRKRLQREPTKAKDAARFKRFFSDGDEVQRQPVLPEHSVLPDVSKYKRTDIGGRVYDSLRQKVLEENGAGEIVFVVVVKAELPREASPYVRLRRLGHSQACVTPPPLSRWIPRGRTVRCARAVRKVGYFGLFPPMTKMTAVTTVFPDTGLLRFLPSPKTQIMSSNKQCFTLKMPECCLNLLFLPCGRSSPGGGWSPGWSEESLPTIGRCACAVQKRLQRFCGSAVVARDA